MLTARGVVGIERIGQEDQIEHALEAARVAGANAEHGEGLAFGRDGLHIDGLAVHVEVREILTLREERVLGGLHGLGYVQTHVCAGRVLVKIDLLGLLDGQVQLLRGRDAIEGLGQARHGKLLHAFSPLSITIFGSGSFLSKLTSGAREPGSRPA